jgi:hypothetical protein
LLRGRGDGAVGLRRHGQGQGRPYQAEAEQQRGQPADGQRRDGPRDPVQAAVRAPGLGCQAEQQPCGQPGQHSPRDAGGHEGEEVVERGRPGCGDRRDGS